MFQQVKGSQENWEDKASGVSRATEAGSTCGGSDELRHYQPSMANTISNMKMTNPIKGLVSKRRKRFTEDGFDLDLSCILFAMFLIFEKLILSSTLNAQGENDPEDICITFHL